MVYLCQCNDISGHCFCVIYNTTRAMYTYEGFVETRPWLKMLESKHCRQHEHTSVW